MCEETGISLSLIRAANRGRRGYRRDREEGGGSANRAGIEPGRHIMGGMNIEVLSIWARGSLAEFRNE
jgi:hypothetical protein